MRVAVIAGLVASALARGDDFGRPPREEMVFMEPTGEVTTDPVGILRVTRQEVQDAQDTNAHSNRPLQFTNWGAGVHPVADGVSVWVDIYEGVFRAVPAWMQHQAIAVSTSSRIDPRFPFFFQCVPRTASQCEVYAFAYPCVDCPDFEHGNFIRNMNANGWESFKCAPSVEFENSPGHLHALTGFRMIMSPYERKIFFIDEAAEFFTFAVDVDPQACETIADESDCNNNTKGKCLWENNECLFNTCRPDGKYGPGVCTTHCLTLDVPTGRGR